MSFPRYNLLNEGIGNGINIFFAGSGPTYDLAYSVGVRKRLLSWAANVQEELSECARKQATHPSFCILDSGAFTVWQQGRELTAESYGKVLPLYLKYYDIAVNLDVIPGKQGMDASQITRQMANEAAKAGLENFKYLQSVLKDKGVDPARLMPVYHQGEGIEYLKILVEMMGCDYIGISPSNDYQTSQRMHWLDDVFDYLGKLPKMPKTHGYGVTSPRLMESYKWFSVDSSSWVQAGGNGQINTPYGIVTLSNREDVMGRPDNFDGGNWTNEMRERIIAYFKSIGFTTEELRSDYKNRWKANAIYLLEYERNYKYKPKPEQEKLFNIKQRPTATSGVDYLGEVRMELYNAVGV